MTHFSTSLELAPGDPDVLGELGVVLLRKGERRRAIACFTKALGNNPQDAISRRYLEVAKQQAGEEDEGTTKTLSTTAKDADGTKLRDDATGAKIPKRQSIDRPDNWRTSVGLTGADTTISTLT